MDSPEHAPGDSGPIYFSTFGFKEGRKDPYNLQNALYRGRCGDCGDHPQWTLDPDADGPSWHGRCQCEGRSWSLTVDMVHVTFYDEED